MTTTGCTTCRPPPTEINLRTENPHAQPTELAMTVRYCCPVSTCGWHHDEADPELPGPVLPHRIPGAALALLTKRYMTVEKIVGAHLECHSRLDFVQEIGLQRARADAAEANCNSLRD